jgi:hypothetical protein
MYALRKGVEGLSSGTRVEVLVDSGATVLVGTAAKITPATTHSHFDKDGKQVHRVSYGTAVRVEVSTTKDNLVLLRDRTPRDED